MSACDDRTVTTAAPTAPSKDQRRSKRFRFHVDVDISDRRGVRRGRAVDVARHGLFVAIVDPPHNRHLVQVVIHLPPPFSGAVHVAATVSRTLSGQGVGLSLFALSDDAKRRWDHFITALQTHQQQLSTTTPLAQLPAASAHAVPSFLLRLKTQARLEEFQRTHVVAGGTVLFTPVLLPAGAPVALVVVHPKTEQEHILGGRVHRAIATSPKRLEILFDASLDRERFRAFVDSGITQLPTVIGESESLPPAPASTTGPTGPTGLTGLPSELPPADDSDLGLDIEVVAEDGAIVDEEMQDDPIEWDLRTSDLPVLVGKEIPATAPTKKPAARRGHTSAFDDGEDVEFTRPAGMTTKPKPANSSELPISVIEEAPLQNSASQLPATTIPVTAPPQAAPHSAVADATDPDEDDGWGVGADDELVIDDSQLVRDPGLRPTPVRLSCDGAKCESDSYVVELGPCGGALGLVADLVPFWSAEQGRIVAVPRLVEATIRRERFHTYLSRGGQIEDLLSLATFLAAADLAEPAHHPETAEPLRSSRAVDRLAIAARRVAVEDVVAPTRVKCPHCVDGHLVLDRA